MFIVYRKAFLLSVFSDIMKNKTGGGMMTSEQIKCFFKVAELGSFTAAAEAMYMTQPALSKRITALEHEFNLVLFSRDKSKKTQLTKAGRVVYDGFQEIEQNMEKILEQARSVASGMTGTVRLGIFENQIIDEYLQEILNDFSRRYKNVELYVTTDSFNGLVDHVLDGKLDCAITIGYDLVGREKIRHRTLYYLKTYLVVPEQFLGEVWKTYTMKDFADKPFLTILQENNNFQDRMIREATRQAGFEPEFIVASDEKNFMMLLEMGKGIAALDAYSKCCNSPNVRCISVPEIPPSPFDLVWSDKNKNPAFHCLLEYLTFEES